jgi:hypothetical protein
MSQVVGQPINLKTSINMVLAQILFGIKFNTSRRWELLISGVGEAHIVAGWFLPTIEWVKGFMIWVELPTFCISQVCERGWRKENSVKDSSPYILQVPLVFYSIANHMTHPSGTFYFPPLSSTHLIIHHFDPIFHMKCSCHVSGLRVWDLFLIWNNWLCFRVKGIRSVSDLGLLIEIQVKGHWGQRGTQPENTLWFHCDFLSNISTPYPGDMCWVLFKSLHQFDHREARGYILITLRKKPAVDPQDTFWKNPQIVLWLFT